MAFRVENDNGLDSVQGEVHCGPNIYRQQPKCHARRLEVGTAEASRYGASHFSPSQSFIAERAYRRSYSSVHFGMLRHPRGQGVQRAIIFDCQSVVSLSHRAMRVLLRSLEGNTAVR